MYTMSHHPLYSPIVLLVVCYITTVSSQGESCQIQDIPVQASFDPQRYAGKWYEVKWLPAYYETEDTILVDYTETYKPSTNGDTIAVEGRGRGVSEHTFITFTKIYTKSQDGKYFTNIDYNNTSVQVDYWIIATDYDNYSLCYGCTIAEQGVCKQAHAWIWSRKRELDQEHYLTIYRSLPQLCLKEIDFRILTQSYEGTYVHNTATFLTSTAGPIQMTIVMAWFYRNGV